MKKVLLSLFFIFYLALSASAASLEKMPYKNLKSWDSPLPADSDYNFLYKNSLIGYSNSEMKFYEYIYDKDKYSQRKLDELEVQKIFTDFRVIKISEFSTSTNSYKVKKGGGKFLVLNDTDRIFDNYGFYSNNAKYKIYPLRSFIKVTKPGMIQFSHFGDNTTQRPWFILLVRK